MKQITYLILGVTLIFTLACTKTEIQDVNTTVKKNALVDSIIGGNKIPPYTGVTTEMVENYINKMYIDLLGREPDATEMNDSRTTLMNGGLDEASRDDVVGDLLGLDEYYQRYHEIMSDRMLNGVDTTTINYEVQLAAFVIQTFLTQGDTLSATVIQFNLDRLLLLQSAMEDFRDGNITINEYFIRLVDNSIYDEINMGTENFVNACFENMFNRFPSEKELEEAVSMVDGQPGVIFSTDGASKLDFLDIVTTVDEFYQGLIFSAYRNLLLRDPTNAEIDNYISSVKTDNSIANLQKELIKSEEYAGF